MVWRRWLLGLAAAVVAVMLAESPPVVLGLVSSQGAGGCHGRFGAVTLLNWLWRSFGSRVC